MYCHGWTSVNCFINQAQINQDKISVHTSKKALSSAFLGAPCTLRSGVAICTSARSM